MLAQQIVESLLGDKIRQPKKNEGQAFAPSNIALIKYWGKLNQDLHLPFNSSVSVSLGDKGARTTIRIIDGPEHKVILNDQAVAHDSSFYQKLKSYLNLFQKQLPYHFEVITYSTVPIAAGVASSACGFAALVLALNDLFDFSLSENKLSILARLGSGSACRSLWQGFVLWQQGVESHGMDSYALPLKVEWPDFMVGLWCFDSSEKSISSREGMQRTVETSSLYKVWPTMAETACKQMCEWIKAKDFSQVGQLAESNALMMHATMHNANPTVNYWQPASVMAMQQVWQARREGLEVYFTMDAGPNLKLLTQKKDLMLLRSAFPDVEWISDMK